MTISTPPAGIDLSPYFAHIGCRQDSAATLETLHRMQRGHLLSIPFENLSPLTGAPVPLDLPALLDKFTRQRRGGYCFEHNTLHRAALESLGFKVTSLLARVRMNAAPDTVTPRTHMLLVVEIDGERLLSDTGFGRATPTSPLRFVEDIVQPTSHGDYRITRHNDVYRLETLVTDGWTVLYEFELRPAPEVDIVMSNWYVSTFPGSHFTRDLIVVRAAEDGRHVLHNTRYSFYGTDGSETRRELESATDMVDVLSAVFGIGAADVESVGQRLEHIAGRPA